jgi:hypothetical protein
MLLRVCLSCALLFVGWPQAASPLLRILQPAPHDPMVRSAFVSHNNKGRQRVYIDSHYLDNIDNNAVIINVHLCSYSEQMLSLLVQDRGGGSLMRCLLARLGSSSLNRITRQPLPTPMHSLCESTTTVYSMRRASIDFGC